MPRVKAYARPEIGAKDKDQKKEEKDSKKSKKDKHGKKGDKDKSDKSDKSKKHKKDKHKKEERDKDGSKKKKKKKDKDKEKDKEKEKEKEEPDDKPTSGSIPPTPTKSKPEKEKEILAKSPTKKTVEELFDPIASDDRSPGPSGKSAAPPSTEEKEVTSPTGTSSGSNQRNPRDRILYEDSSLRVWVNTKINENSTSKFPSCLITVDFTPISKSKDKEKKKEKEKESTAFKSIKLRINNPNKVKIAGFKGKKGTLTEKGAEISFSNVKADETVRETFQLDWSSAMTAPLKVQAKLSYKDKKGKGKSKKECEMYIPLSTFVTPKKVTKTELAEVEKKM